MNDFGEWCPIRIFRDDNGRPMADWIRMGERRFSEPFFEDTVQQLLYHPFHCAFRRVTPLADLAELRPGVAPAGFIFHMSRCGSTLLARMLSAVTKNIVLSECSPLDAVLRQGKASCEERVWWLRWTINALGQPRAGDERNLFVKFDCWNIAQLPLVRRAFPDVPWVFVYRDPLEVFLSHLHIPARWTFPEQLAPEELDLDPRMPHDEYCAHALARICELACEHLTATGGRPMHYREVVRLAAAGCEGLFGVTYSDCERLAIAGVAAEDSKNPGQPFLASSDARRAQATAHTRELCAAIIEPVYRKLESLDAARF
jgi:hypothetical protein